MFQNWCKGVHKSTILLLCGWGGRDAKRLEFVEGYMVDSEVCLAVGRCPKL